MPDVLLVDDDAPIRRMLERTLTAEGYAITAVADGGSALAQVERSLPDVIVLDVAMPGLDGLAVTRRLRAKGLVMVATDGHRLAMVEKEIALPGLEESYRALLPRKAMSEIQKLSNDDPSKKIEFSEVT